MNIEIVDMEVHCGQNFGGVSIVAKEKATRTANVRFVFNGINCIVSQDTDTELLFRDYQNSSALGKTTIGPICIPEISDADKKAIEKYQCLMDEERAIATKLRDERNAVAEEFVNGFLQTNPFQASGNVDEWNAGLERTDLDGYVMATVQFADKWARMMQHYRTQGMTMNECMAKSEENLHYMDITGNMYGFAVALLSSNWKFGEELRAIHNAKYGHSGNGVVNPAIMTLKV
jgi:hypothetical protein